MKYKVIKNAAGEVVCFGPNDEHYAPNIPAGCTLSLTDAAPPPTLEQMRAPVLADFRTKREAYLNRVSGIGFAAREAGDSVTAAAAVAVRQGLLDLPAHPSVKAATDPDTLNRAIRARYAEIIAAVPLAAKAAFRKVDA